MFATRRSMMFAILGLALAAAPVEAGGGFKFAKQKRRNSTTQITVSNQTTNPASQVGVAIDPTAATLALTPVAFTAFAALPGTTTAVVLNPGQSSNFTVAPGSHVIYAIDLSGGTGGTNSITVNVPQGFHKFVDVINPTGTLSFSVH